MKRKSRLSGSLPCCSPSLRPCSELALRKAIRLLTARRSVLGNNTWRGKGSQEVSWELVGKWQNDGKMNGKKWQNDDPQDIQHHTIAGRVLILCAPRSRMGTKQRQGWGHRGGKGTQMRGSSRNFFPWRRNLRAGGLFFSYPPPLCFPSTWRRPGVGTHVRAGSQALATSIHPSTHAGRAAGIVASLQGFLGGRQELKTSQTLLPSRSLCPFPSELLPLLGWWHPEGLRLRRGSPHIAPGVAKASGQDAKRTWARKGEVREIFFSGKGPDPVPSQPVCGAGRTLLAPGEVLQALSGAREGSVWYGAALGRAARASRRLGRGWVKAKRGNEVSQLLLHVSKKRRRRRVNRETQISPAAPSQSSTQS